MADYGGLVDAIRKIASHEVDEVGNILTGHGEMKATLEAVYDWMRNVSAVDTISISASDKDFTNLVERVRKALYGPVE